MWWHQTSPCALYVRAADFEFELQFQTLQVREQVEHVALAVKQGSQVSDMRHHTFSGRLVNAQVRNCYSWQMKLVALSVSAPVPDLRTMNWS